MKTIKYIIIAVLLITQVRCIDKKFENEFKISVTPDAVVSKVNLNLVDVGDASKPIPTANISFSGEASDKIYTPEGKKEFVASDGVLSFGLLSSLSPSFENPINITMTVEALGYDTKSQTIVFDGTNQSQLLTVTLNKTGEEAPGIQVVSKTVALNDNKTTSSIEITNTNESEEEGVSEEVEESVLTIEADTGFLDEDGMAIEGGDIVVDAQTFDTEINLEEEEIPAPEQTAFESVPDGGFSLEAVEEDPTSTAKTYKLSATNNYNNTYLVSLGNPYCFYIYVNGRKVYWLSRETTVRTYVYYRYVRNPSTGQPVAAGDVVDVYRRDYYGRYYKLPTKGIIKSDRGRLYAEYKTRYTGVHYFGFTGGGANTCNSFNKVTFKNEGRPTYYYFMLTSPTGRYVSSFSSYIGGEFNFYGSWLNYYYYNRLRPLLNSGLKLTIYGYNYSSYRYEKVYDKEVSWCDIDNQTIDVKTSECATYYNLDLNFNCEKVNVALNYTPVYYKKVGDPYFRYYQYIYRGYLRGYGTCFDDESEYQFRVYYDREWRVSPTVKGKDLTIDFDPTAICNYIEDSL
ncbi:hypothetical protein [Wenyingzhuangia sp. IMCC45467]